MDLWAVNIFMIAYNILCFFSNLLFRWAFRGQKLYKVKIKSELFSSLIRDNLL